MVYRERFLPEDTVPVRIEAWRRDTTFGVCPACGSVGTVIAPSSDSDLEHFRCSRTRCTTISREEVMIGSGQKMDTEARTEWWDKKPKWWHLREISGESWNFIHFSQQFRSNNDSL